MTTQELKSLQVNGKFVSAKIRGIWQVVTIVKVSNNGKVKVCIIGTQNAITVDTFDIQY
jgi:hypothetical protein